MVRSHDKLKKCKENFDIQIKQMLTDRLSKVARPSEDGLIEKYVTGLLSILNKLELSGFNLQKQKKAIIGSLKAKIKDLTSYVNLACEISAIYYFQRRFPKGFQYQVNNHESIAAGQVPKNFDFSFISNNYNFNVEVKALSKRTDSELKSFKSFLPKAETHKLYEAGIRFASNCRPAIERILADANTQLLRPNKGLSVVLLCCNDLDVYADAMECIAGDHGLIRSSANLHNPNASSQEVVSSIKDVKNIDAIVVCKLSFGHLAITDTHVVKSFYHDDLITLSNGSELWQYERIAFPAGILLNREGISEDLILTFKKSFLSYSDLIALRNKENGGDLQAAIFKTFNEISRANKDS